MKPYLELSESTLYTILEYLNNLRLQNALEDLLHSRKSLTSIALDNGFTNPSMFSKAFKKKYGVSPTDYKKNE